MDGNEVIAEVERREATRQFWRGVHQRYPLAAGHQELGEKLLAKYADKVGPMSIEEGMEFIGSETVKEIERRKRRDTANRESHAFGDTGPMAHGHRIARDGQTTLEPGEPSDVDPREMSLAAAIRKSKEQRRNAQKRFNSNMRNFGDREARR